MPEPASRRKASRAARRPARRGPEPAPAAPGNGQPKPTDDADLFGGLATLGAELDGARRALEASEARFHAFLDDSPVVAFEKDEDGRYVYANDTLARFLGREAPACVGRTDFDLWPSDVAARIRRSDQALMARGEGDRALETVIAPDGRQHTWLTYRFPVRDSAGHRNLGVLGLDVTDFKATESALQATQERLERVLSSSPTVLYALFVEGDSLGLTWVSRNMPALLGYSVEEAMAPAWWEKNLHPEDLGSASAGIGRLFADGHLTHEYRLRHRNGPWVWVRDDMRLRRDAKGRPVEIFGSWADITERREAEQVLQRDKAELEARVDARTSELRAANARLQVELAERQRAEEASRQSEERLQIVAQATNDAIRDQDLATGAVWWNQGVQALFGYGPADVGPDAAWMLEQVHPADRSRVQQAFDALVAESGPAWSMEYRFRRADGTYASVLDRGHVLRDEAGRPLRLVGAMLDITARRRAEEALHEANDKLQAWVAELEQRNSEMALLGEMGELLQTCTTADEAYDVIAHSAQQLFREVSGAVYVFRHSRNVVERTASWGAVPPSDHGFEPDECWALRRGRLHVVEGPGGLRCPHLKESAVEGSLCIPMMAQGEALGILHLASSPESLVDSRRRFAQTVAESLALGLANLRLREALRSQAIRDPLTGLFNRRFMEEALEREMRRALRRLSPLAVLMLDLDHFKQLNDTLGHDAGDALLRELGLFLQNHVRSADIACRYGGEEITLILPDATLAHARQRAEELLGGVREIVIQDRGRTIGPVTVSIGVAAYPDHGDSTDALVRAADAALYAAKAAGRDRVVVAAT